MRRPPSLEIRRGPTYSRVRDSASRLGGRCGAGACGGGVYRALRAAACARRLVAESARRARGRPPGAASGAVLVVVDARQLLARLVVWTGLPAAASRRTVGAENRPRSLDPNGVRRFDLGTTRSMSMFVTSPPPGGVNAAGPGSAASIKVNLPFGSVRWTRTARRCRPSLADRWRPHRGVDGRSAGFGHRPGTTAPGSVSPAIRIGLGCRLGAAGSGLESAQAPPAVSAIRSAAAVRGSTSPTRRRPSWSTRYRLPSVERTV